MQKLFLKELYKPVKILHMLRGLRMLAISAGFSKKRLTAVRLNIELCLISNCFIERKEKIIDISNLINSFFFYNDINYNKKQAFEFGERLFFV